MRTRYLMAVALLAALAVPAAAQQPATAPSTDARFTLYTAVADAVDHYASYSVFDSVHAAIDDAGTVTLTGKVTQHFKVRGIERQVAKVDGVTAVRNELELYPVSRYDDALRLTLARAIYDNPHFRQYGAVSPPIHILVERGHVRVEGVVLSETDRALARAIVRSVPAFSTEVDLKTTAEARSALEQL